MTKKQQKYFTLDPIKINNFNKLLSTLDKTNYLLDDNVDKRDTSSATNIELKEETKEQIDKLLDIINANFKNSNYYNSGFISKIFENKNLKYLNDPNVYTEEKEVDKTMKNIKIDKQTNTPVNTKIDIQTTILPNLSKHYKPFQETEAQNEVIYRENIDIDINIKNIDDILNLINKYQNDPAIKYNINIKALHNIKEPLEELNNMIGMNELKNNILDQILYFIQGLHKDANGISCDYMHTVIYGPPGTGKTEIAKIMGKIYSKLGILSGNNTNKPIFKKVTRSDLIAGYLGQTALKTQDVIKEAVGGVLFIDEAYSLGNSEKRDSFSKECIDTLCEALSDQKNNLMVIIAGYEKELKECFFSYNQGLDSRFTWRFKTDKYNAEDLYKIFHKKVIENGWEINENSDININWFEKNKEYFRYFGRDIETIFAKTKIAHSKRVFCKPISEKKKIILDDLNKGLEIHLKNEEVTNKKKDEEFKKILQSTIYC